MLTKLRIRMLAAALVPVLVVVIATLAIFLTMRLDDLYADHRQHARILLRQLGTSSQYALFSGNQPALQAVAQTVSNEADVLGVAVFDANGALMAAGGAWGRGNFGDATRLAQPSQRADNGVDTFLDPISPGTVVLDEFVDHGLSAASEPTQVLGYAVVQMSRASLAKRTQSLVFWAVSLGLAGVLLAWLIAERLVRRLMRPVMRVSQRIAQIGRGDFSLINPSAASDPLAPLQVGLNEMAQQLRVGRDALEQRVAQVTQELRLKKEEAEIATIAKTRFLAAASHDLRQPTHALGLLVAHLGQLPMSEPMQKVVHNVDLAVQATQDLLDALLDVSRFDAGAVGVNLQPVNLAELLGHVHLNLGAMAQAKGLRLRMRPGRHWVMSDATLLNRIVMNLAHNAVRYTERGTVLVTCRPVGGGTHIRIDVLDSGIGIGSAHQERIFQEFFQVGNAQRDRTYGLGLGLSIVDRGARLLQHAIGLRSTPGGGTRFSITVPVAAATAPAARTTGNLRPPYRIQESGSVMVIEDDVLALEAITTLLQSWGYEVRGATDPQQARQALQAGFMPNVLVTDYRLGGAENGIGAIASLREHAGFAIAACLISGDADAALIKAAEAAGLPLLHKPVRPAQLRSLLRHLLRPPGPGD